MATHVTKTGAVNSAILSTAVPVLTSTEINVVGDILGEGGFCTVSAVRRIKLLDDNDRPSLPGAQLYIGMDDDEKVDAGRNFATQFECYEKKYYTDHKIVLPGRTPPIDPMDTVQLPPRLALKRVKSSLKKKKYQIGVNDLMAEVSVLSKCSHPNIITLYAVGCDEDRERRNEDGDGDGSISSSLSISFAVIDQLRSTLKNKLYKWKEDRGVGIIQSKKAVHRLWLERMVDIKKVADAIQYLHSKGFVHRDINPANIGYTDDDVVKLFDFGLAKFVSGDEHINRATSSKDDDDNAIFDLTGCTGTLRYMAPEIALGLPYGLKVDVHSFAILMHEILSLSKPYIRLQANNFHDKVVVEGLRPSLDESWPLGIRDLLKKMWSRDSGQRLSSKDVMEILGNLLRGKDDDLYPTTWMDRLVRR